MATYEPVTQDGEVEDINLVQVEEASQVEEKRVLTLSYLNTQIATVTQSITTKQAELAGLQAIKVKVQAEAKKVKLKDKEKEKEIL